ncbi:MAG: hypothetical protein U0X20_09405 [Caldilineaceae bacterium]
MFYAFVDLVEQVLERCVGFHRDQRRGSQRRFDAVERSFDLAIQSRICSAHIVFDGAPHSFQFDSLALHGGRVVRLGGFHAFTSMEGKCSQCCRSLGVAGAPSRSV